MGGKLSFLDGSHQVVMVGLDGAGKSTLLYRLKMDHFVQAPPTIGFNCEKFKPSRGKAKGTQFTLWDVGGQEKLRPLWRSYTRHTDAVLFVVDSAEAERFEEARLELANLLRSPDLPPSLPLLLLANKQDLPGALTPSQVEKALGLGDYSPGHPVEVLPCCAVTGEGLDPTFDLLMTQISAARKSRKKSATRL